MNRDNEITYYRTSTGWRETKVLTRDYLSFLFFMIIMVTGKNIGGFFVVDQNTVDEMLEICQSLVIVTVSAPAAH